MSGFHVSVLVAMAKDEFDERFKDFADESIQCLESVADTYSIKACNDALDKAIADHKESFAKVLKVMAAKKHARQSKNYLPLLNEIGFYRGFNDPESRLPVEIEAEALGLFDLPQ